jgi:hypothetical protein
MRLAQTVLIAVLAGPMLAGCLPARTCADGSVAARQFSGPTGDDVVRVDIAIIERPAGDAYLSQDLWDFADEQMVDFDRKPVLDENGFRVGLIGGLLPADLLALLSSGKSCSEPHRVQMRAGGTTPVELGGERAHCEFVLTRAGRVTAMQVDNARCLLEIVATPAEDGRMELRFTPVVKHGAARREPRVVRDPSGERRWDLEVQQSTESYAALSWEVSVRPEEYVVIGTRVDRDGTLGNNFFLDTDAASPIQRILVIRSGRISSGTESIEARSNGYPPPLALQAGWRSARGLGPLNDNADRPSLGN